MKKSTIRKNILLVAAAALLLIAMAALIPTVTASATSAPPASTIAPAPDIVDELPENQDIEGINEESGAESFLIPGIPNLHLFLFAGGLIVCIAALILISVIGKRKGHASSSKRYYDDDDYEDGEDI